MSITCSYCGTEINDGETKCPFCETEVENTSVPAVEETPAPVVEEVKPEPVAAAPVVEEVKPEPAVEAESTVAVEEVAPEAEAAAAPLWICTKCGKEFESATKFCGECGGKVEEKKPIEEIVPVWICTQCGKEFDSATKFCGECGGKVEEKNPVEEIVPVWICTQCGKEFESATKFCGECGSKVEEKNPVEEIVPVWICTQCGKEFESATKFCGECGGKVEEKGDSAKINIEESKKTETDQKAEPANCCSVEDKTDFTEECKEILAELHDGNIYYVTHFDKQKLAIAMESYGKGLVKNQKDIIFHHDATLFKGAKEGHILTGYGIAYKKLFEKPKKVLFNNTTRLCIEKNKDDWSVSLNGDQLNMLSYGAETEEKRKLLERILKQVVEKNKQNSVSANTDNIVEQYRNKLQQLHDGDYCFVSSFDEKRLTSAMQTYGCNLVKSEKDIIVWHDSSSRCTGKEGFILTNYGFVWNRDGYKETYLFDKSTRFTINEDDDGIYFGFNLRRGELGCWGFEKQNGKISRNENLLLDTISEIVNSYKN